MNQLFAGTRLAQHVAVTKVAVRRTIEAVESASSVMQEPDRRYRVMILLQRSDRPHYWTFACPHCKHDVAEIMNADVEAISDIVSMENANNIGIGIRCDGPYCRYWYYFKLNGGN